MSTLLRNKKEFYSSPSRPSHFFPDDAQLARNVLMILFKGYPNPITVRLWNGETICADTRSNFCIVVNDPSVISDVLLRRDLTMLTRHYLNGLFTVEGRLEELFHLVEWMSHHPLTLQEKWFITRNSIALSGIKTVFSPGSSFSPSSSFSSLSMLSRHKCVGNSFYRLWLDADMEYSCAFYDEGNQSLPAAQKNKFNQVCRKLGLNSGQHILDVGCG